MLAQPDQLLSDATATIQERCRKRPGITVKDSLQAFFYSYSKKRAERKGKERRGGKQNKKKKSTIFSLLHFRMVFS